MTNPLAHGELTVMQSVAKRCIEYLKQLYDSVPRIEQRYLDNSLQIQAEAVAEAFGSLLRDRIKTKWLNKISSPEKLRTLNVSTLESVMKPGEQKNLGSLLDKEVELLQNGIFLGSDHVKVPAEVVEDTITMRANVLKAYFLAEVLVPAARDSFAYLLGVSPAAKPVAAAAGASTATNDPEPSDPPAQTNSVPDQSGAAQAFQIAAADQG